MPRAKRPKANASRPTREDVAKLAFTSGSTVSRVFSGRTDIPIADETRTRVLEAAKQLGYLPNSAAQALTNGKTGIVGFWICLEYSRYRAQVLDAMRAVIGPSGMALSVANVDEEYRWDNNFLRPFRASVDGIIAFDSTVSLKAFSTIGPSTPFVSMGAIWSKDFSYVGIDLLAGTQLAMSHLFDTGRRRIALVSPERWGLHHDGPRLEGYSQAMADHDFEPELILTGEPDVAAMRETFRERVERKTLPEALFCINDDVAIAIARALTSLGVRIGHDIGIVGVDGIKETEEEPCPITTVRQPIEIMCASALEFLENQIRNPRAAIRQKILVPELIIRESTRT